MNTKYLLPPFIYVGHEFVKIYIKQLAVNFQRICLIPLFNLTQGREVMKQNDKYVLLYIYFTTRTMKRYVFTGRVLKSGRSYRHLFQESTAVNSRVIVFS